MMDSKHNSGRDILSVVMADEILDATTTTIAVPDLHTSFKGSPVGVGSWPLTLELYRLLLAHASTVGAKFDPLSF